MKLILLFPILFVCLFTFGQTIPTDTETGKFQYEEVIQVENTSKTDIYDRAKNWVVRTLKSGDNIVNLDDAEKESITATGNILLQDRAGAVGYSNIILNFKFSVYFKEGRCKLVIDNFILDYTVVFPDANARKEPRVSPLEEGFKKEGWIKGNKQAQKTYEEVDEKIKSMISDFKSTVKTGAVPGDKKDDW